MDETYIKIKGRWHYLYRAIDADGLTLDIWLRKKRRADDNSYKLEDTAYQEDKARKAETEDKLAIEAMKSKYTTLLLENMLLSPFEMQDTKIMAGLQVHVSPLYDELKELRGLNSVKHKNHPCEFLPEAEVNPSIWKTRRGDFFYTSRFFWQ